MKASAFDHRPDRELGKALRAMLSAEVRDLSQPSGRRQRRAVPAAQRLGNHRGDIAPPEKRVEFAHRAAVGQPFDVGIELFGEGVAEVLARKNVRQVGLDHRNVDGGDRISQGDRVVRVGTGIQHDAVDLTASRMQGVDQLALDVALHVAQDDRAVDGIAVEIGHEVVERGRAVYVGLALTEQVEVRAVYDEKREGHPPMLPLHGPVERGLPANTCLTDLR